MQGPVTEAELDRIEEFFRSRGAGCIIDLCPLADAGQKVQTFRPGQVSTVYPCQLSSLSPLFGAGNDCTNTGVVPVGLVVPGDKGIPNGLSDSYYKSFAPRIGMAWSPDAKDGVLGKIFGGPGKSSIRAGFGVSLLPLAYAPDARGITFVPIAGTSTRLDLCWGGGHDRPVRESFLGVVREWAKAGADNQ